MALSMVLNGANGETQTALLNTLGFEQLTPAEINSIYLDLITALKKADDKVVMKIANSIWIRNGFPVQESFTKINHEINYAKEYGN